MAGIGFVLRKLARQDNLLGLARAYTHSALAATGPWLFTLFALASIMSIAKEHLVDLELLNFRTIIVYNFSFSLVLSGPFFMVATRFLADQIHDKDVSRAPGMLIGVLLTMFVLWMPCVILFYLKCTEFEALTVILTVLNFFLISCIWVVSVFVTALKNYRAVTMSFVIGLSIAVLLSKWFSSYYGMDGALIAFNIGLTTVFSLLMARVFAEYPYKLVDSLCFLSYFKKYWEIALGGLLYNMAIWIDKWMMWFSDDAIVMENGLVMYPDYDSAMFLAFLTVVPSMAVFIFSVETNFYEQYLRFYRDIKNRATFRKIEKNHMAVMASIFSSARNFLFLQGGICLITIFMAPSLFEFFSINFEQLGMFRYGVLGALFHVLTMFLIILLSYFDNRKMVFLLQILFLLCNAGLTWFFMDKGFEFYGYGYFLSSLIVFIFSAFLTVGYVMKLPYHTFITSNSSIKS